MPYITVDLLRRRAEHNDGLLENLEEIALHQQDLEAITVIGDVCRHLQILLLQNNLIPRIENLHHLKSLTYLNLALNNITKIEGLESCENLHKLDLTVNFVNDLTSIANLQANPHLRSLYLVGNGCAQVPGYRHFVSDVLQQLDELDGVEITRSDRITAKQEAASLREEVRIQREIVAAEEAEKQRQRDLGIEKPRAVNEKGEKLYGHSPEERMAAHRDMMADQEKARQREPTQFERMTEEAKPRVYTPEEEIERYGRVLQKNQMEVKYRLWNDGDVIRLNVELPRYLSTTLIDVDVQPKYIRITVKRKVLQLLLEREVNPDKASVQRSQTNGHLLVTMPVDKSVVAPPEPPRVVRPRSGDGDDEKPQQTTTTESAAATVQSDAVVEHHNTVQSEPDTALRCTVEPTVVPPSSVPLSPLEDID